MGVLGVKDTVAKYQRRNILEENQGVQTEVADPSTEKNTDQTSAPEETPKAIEDPNWKEAREVMRQQQREIQELKDKLVQTHSSQSQKELDELDSLASDDIVTVAQARKLAEKVAEKTASKLLKEKEVETMEDRTSSRYPDYADVVTKYIPKIIKDDPDLAEAIRNSPNPYVTAYKIAKNSYIYKKDTENANKASQTAQKVLENSSKPQSVHSQGYQGALSNAEKFEGGLSQEKRKEVWELSRRYAQGR